jgi:hypothetical protein
MLVRKEEGAQGAGIENQVIGYVGAELSLIPQTV